MVKYRIVISTSKGSSPFNHPELIFKIPLV